MSRLLRSAGRGGGSGAAQPRIVVLIGAHQPLLAGRPVALSVSLRLMSGSGQGALFSSGSGRPWRKTRCGQLRRWFADRPSELGESVRHGHSVLLERVGYLDEAPLRAQSCVDGPRNPVLAQRQVDMRVLVHDEPPQGLQLWASRRAARRCASAGSTGSASRPDANRMRGAGTGWSRGGRGWGSTAPCSGRRSCAWPRAGAPRRHPAQAEAPMRAMAAAAGGSVARAERKL